MNRVLFGCISAGVIVTAVIVLGMTQEDAIFGFVSDVSMHPCQKAALDYMKSYDKSIQENTSSVNDMLSLMTNDLDCYDMKNMEPKDDWYTEEFKKQLKKELIKSFTR